MQGVSDYNAIINDYRRLLVSDLANSNIKFIRSQGNKVVHSLAREAPHHSSFRIFIKITSCISTLMMNEMY